MARSLLFIVFAIIAFANCDSPSKPIQQTVNAVVGTVGKVVENTAEVAGNTVNKALNVGGVAIKSGVQGTAHVVGAVGNALGVGIQGTAGVLGALGNAFGHVGNSVADAISVNPVIPAVEKTLQKRQASIPQSPQYPGGYPSQGYPSNYPNSGYPKPSSQNFGGLNGYLGTVSTPSPGHNLNSGPQQK